MKDSIIFSDLISSFQIPEDRGIVEESKVSHVLTLLELGRVYLPNLGRLELLFLKKKFSNISPSTQYKLLLA